MDCPYASQQLLADLAGVSAPAEQLDAVAPAEDSEFGQTTDDMPARPWLTANSHLTPVPRYYPTDIVRTALSRHSS